VAERQISGPHLHGHVGECRPEYPSDPATGTTSSARHSTMSSVQLFRCPQQYAALCRSILRVQKAKAETPAFFIVSSFQTCTAHDCVQRSTRSQP
jgi:hypothetical protein